MPHRIAKWLEDIRISISHIEEFVGPCRNFIDYQNNLLMRRGIERELEIIGEAVRRIMEKDPDIAITSARDIIGLRNWVIHAYDSINDNVIWKVVIKDLPILKEEIELLLSKY